MKTFNTIYIYVIAAMIALSSCSSMNKSSDAKGEFQNDNSVASRYRYITAENAAATEKLEKKIVKYEDEISALRFELKYEDDDAFKKYLTKRIDKLEGKKTDLEIKHTALQEASKIKWEEFKKSWDNNLPEIEVNDNENNE